MKKVIGILVCVATFLHAVTQTYSLRTRLELEAAQYDAMVIKDSFIYCAGIVADSIAPFHTVNVFSKYDLNGVLIFSKVFKGDSGEFEIGTFENSLITTSDNGFALTGYIIAVNNAIPLFIKYDSVGEVQFYKSYPYVDSKVFLGRQIVETDNGYFIQSINQQLNFDVDICLIKTDLNGNRLWQKFYGFSNSDEQASAFIVTNSNRLFIAGYSNNRKYSDYANFISYSYLLWLDTAGLIIRDSIGTDPNIGIPQSIIETEDGNFVYCTNYALSKTQAHGIYVTGYMAKVDSSLNLLWEGTYGDSCPDALSGCLYDLKEQTDGSLLAVGVNYNQLLYPNYHENGLIIKTDASGNQLWRREYRGVTRIGQQLETNILYDCDILSDGSIVACGVAQDDNDTFPQQAWLLRIDSNGCMDNSWCGYTGIEEVKNESEEEVVVKVYPNPAKDYIILEMNVGMIGGVVKIYDVIGNVIYRREENNLATNYTKVLDLSWLTSGIYFVTVNTERGSVTKQVVKE